MTMSADGARRPRPLPHLLRLLGAFLLISALNQVPAAAQPSTAPGPAGLLGATAEPGSVGKVTAEPTEGLPEDGAVVTVTGTDFDPSAGIYVAVCVDNGPGEKPSPCIGGADTAGTGGAIWISDNPPSYAEGLTLPYGPDGSFTVELPVPVEDPVNGVDCRVDTCAVTVRFDHLRGEDRRADHVIPLSFGESAEEEPEETAPSPDPVTEEDEEAEAVTEPEEAVTDEATGDAGSTTDGPSGALIAIAAAVVLAVVGTGAWLRTRSRRNPSP